MVDTRAEVNPGCWHRNPAPYHFATLSYLQYHGLPQKNEEFHATSLAQPFCKDTFSI